MELDGDSSPFWSQPSQTTTTVRRRQPTSPPIINPVILILLLPILTLVILFFLVPPLLSHTTQILRPNSVKKGWDSFNILLVVFAILCGVFARRNDDTPSSAANQRNRIGSATSDDQATNFNDGSTDDTPQSVSNDRWYEYSQVKAYNSAPIETGVNRLRRSSSSYPDLRQVVQQWESSRENRFFDDFGVNLYRSSIKPDYLSGRPQRSERRRQESDINVIPVDTFQIRSEEPAIPSLQANLKRRRSFHSVPRKDKAEIIKTSEAEVEVNQKQEPPPPPPQPTETMSPPVEKPQKLQRKKSGTKELATAIASLYNQSKRKKKTKKRRDIFENISESCLFEEPVLPPPTPIPPPPPPPPPPSKVFQNLFKKNRKSKRVHSDPSTAQSAPPPPPPPPPPNSMFNNLFKTGNKSKRFQQPLSTTPPPPPPPPPPSSILNNLFKHGTRSRRFKSTPPPPPPPPPPQSTRRRSSKPPLPTKPAGSYYEENLNSGSESPLIPMPPPPPPPPFKMRERKFVPAGDFVRILSTHSSRCSSPELEDVDVVSVISEMDGEDSIGASVFCPSPDVNVKADSFIARLRDEWRLEKINSVRESRNLS